MRRGDGAMPAALVSGGVTASLVLLVSLPFILAGGSNLSSTAVIFLINVCLVVAIQTFVGNSGVLSFGHVAFMGVGAYVTAWLTIPSAVKADQIPELPTWLLQSEVGLLPALAAAALASAGVAAVVGLVLMRMTVNATVMATFALLLVMYSIWLNWSELTRGSNGLFGVPRLTTPAVALVAAMFFIIIARLFKSTRLGLRLRASREDALAASMSGIDVQRTRYVAWVFSGALMGAGGSLWAFNVIAFDPGQFSFAMTFALLAMLIVGGQQSVLGAAVGAAIVVAITEIFSRVEQGVSIGGIELPRITGTVQFVIAVLIILALILRPEGLIGRREIEDYIPPLRRLTHRLRSTPSGAKSETSIPDPHRGDVILLGSGLSKAFRGVQAVRDVDIELRSGEILGLIGPNGSGKSTLLNLLSGVTEMDSGTVTLAGLNVTEMPSYRVARNGMARTFQNIRLFLGLSVEDNVLAPQQATVSTAMQAIDQLGISRHQFTEAGTLPYGLQRRLEIARAVGTRPKVILLDEPAAGMNHSESDVLLQDLRSLAEKYACGVIIIDHDLRLIMRLCSRIQVMEAGRTIAIGTPGEISVDPAVSAAYLGDSAADVSIEDELARAQEGPAHE